MISVDDYLFCVFSILAHSAVIIKLLNYSFCQPRETNDWKETLHLQMTEKKAHLFPESYFRHFAIAYSHHCRRRSCPRRRCRLRRLGCCRICHGFGCY